MKIEFRDSQGSFRYFEVRKGEATIGRSKKCDIPLPYESLSRTHARIDILEGDDATVTDLGSSNGTFLNDKKIDPNMPESFSSLFSFTLGDGIQMRLMEESEELPEGKQFVVIREAKKRPSNAPPAADQASQSNIKTQMVGSRKSRTQTLLKQSKKDQERLAKNQASKGSSKILRAIIFLLFAALVYLYLTE